MLHNHAAVPVNCQWGLVGIHLSGCVHSRGSRRVPGSHFESHWHPVLPWLLCHHIHCHPCLLHHWVPPPPPPLLLLLWLQSGLIRRSLCIKTSWRHIWATCSDTKHISNSSDVAVSFNSDACSLSSSSSLAAIWSYLSISVHQYISMTHLGHAFGHQACIKFFQCTLWICSLHGCEILQHWGETLLFKLFLISLVTLQGGLGLAIIFFFIFRAFVSPLQLQVSKLSVRWCWSGPVLTAQ